MTTFRILPLLSRPCAGAGRWRPEHDHLADLYAWGVIAYELLAGAHVVDGWVTPHALENSSRDMTQEYLADGLTDELIGRVEVHTPRAIMSSSILREHGVRLD